MLNCNSLFSEEVSGSIWTLFQMFGAMFGAAMFGDGDEDDMNEFFMGKLAFSPVGYSFWSFWLLINGWYLRDGIGTIGNVLRRCRYRLRRWRGNNGGVHDGTFRAGTFTYINMKCFAECETDPNLTSNVVDRSQRKGGDAHLTDESFQPLTSCEHIFRRGIEVRNFMTIYVINRSWSCLRAVTRMRRWLGLKKLKMARLDMIFAITFKSE